MVEITQCARNQRSPAEGKGKGQKLLAQGVLGNFNRTGRKVLEKVIR